MFSTAILIIPREGETFGKGHSSIGDWKKDGGDKKDGGWKKGNVVMCRSNIEFPTFQGA